MTEILNIQIESEDLKNFKETTGMSLADCIKILVNSVKYGGKLEFDTFWSEENISELKKIAEDAKHGRNISRHDLIEVD